MLIPNEFEIGQIVYQRINTEHTALHVIGINVHPNNVLTYVCNTHDSNDHCFYAFELTLDRDDCLIH